MAMTDQPDNAATLERELEWLSTVITARMAHHFQAQGADADLRENKPPDFFVCPYAAFVDAHQMSFDERLVLILALAPYIRPQVLDPLLVKQQDPDRGFTEFGGVSLGHHGGFWPTIETAAFVLAGEQLDRRFEVQALFEPDHFFRREKVLDIGDVDTEPSRFNVALKIAKERLNQFTTGAEYNPGFSSSFPAKRLTTPKCWDDLVLPRQTLEDVEEIKAWLKHRDTLLNVWQLSRKINPGFRSLLYGPPGTGKTLTAALLGQTTGCDVYRVDLSLVVSKWIGETEKNLANIFDHAENNDWILFFDEADALFGKRTQTASAHDRYANQEVSYLLQRIEDFPGVVVLASNFKGNMDEAFSRRFQSMIYFPVPRAEERVRLWQRMFAPPLPLDAEVDFEQLAAEFEITGGGIVNVLRYASLMALRRGTDTIRLDDIRTGVRREFDKDGRVV
jgi:adenylate kinase family enzyme